MTMNDDSIQMLQNCRLPLTSFSLIGIVGSTGSGKTYQLMNIVKAYIEQAKTTRNYDIFNQYNINNGNFTHLIYISPTAKFDRTFREQNQNLNLLLFDGTEKSTILGLCNVIRDMNTKVQVCLEFQQLIFDNISSPQFQQEKQYTYQKFRKYLGFMKQVQAKYPELRVPITDRRIIQLFSDLDNNFPLYFIRRPKIGLAMDDMSSSSLFTNCVENEFYKILIQRRHLGIYFSILNIHNIKTVYSQLRSQMSQFLLMQTLKQDSVKDLFEDIGKLRSRDFTEQDFLDLYYDHIGYNINDYKLREKCRYNFLYIMIQPRPAIYKNFDEQIK